MITLQDFKPTYSADGMVRSWFATVHIALLDIIVEREFLVTGQALKPLDQWSEAEKDVYRQKAVDFPSQEPIFYGNPTPTATPDTINSQ